MIHLTHFLLAMRVSNENIILNNLKPMYRIRMPMLCLSECELPEPPSFVFGQGVDPFGLRARFAFTKLVCGLRFPLCDLVYELPAK